MRAGARWPGAAACCSAVRRGDARPDEALIRRLRLHPLVLIGPGEHFEAEAVRIEDEDRPVAWDVAVLLDGEMDPRPDLDSAVVHGVDLLAPVDPDPDVLDADVVVPVLAAVRAAEADRLLPGSDAEVDHVLGAAVGRKSVQLLHAQRAEQREV